MSSTSTTTYYGLTQYIGTDKPSFLDNNEAFGAVDAALHGAVTDVASQGETISSLSETVGTLSGNVTSLGNDLDTEKGKIVALQNKEELQDAAIAGVKTAALDMICAFTEASATSTHAYAIGDYFRYQDVLYQATSAIEIGDTIVPNVNCSATNVTEELDKVMAAIPTTAANIPLAAITGMTADDVQEGIAELKSDLAGKISDDLANQVVGETGVVKDFYVFKTGNNVIMTGKLTISGGGTFGNNAKLLTLPESLRPSVSRSCNLVFFGDMNSGTFGDLTLIPDGSVYAHFDDNAFNASIARFSISWAL